MNRFNRPAALQELMATVEAIGDGWKPPRVRILAALVALVAEGRAVEVGIGRWERRAHGVKSQP